MSDIFSRHPCPPNSTRYTIQPGDTLYAIARANNIPLGVLLAANPAVNPNALAVGQTVCIPYMAAPTACPRGYAPYTVVAGDTMYKIAARHGIAPSTLLAANPSVDANSLSIGQTICVPR